MESEHCKLQCADVRVVTSICAVTLLATASFTIVFTRETPLGGRFGDDAPEGPRSGAAMVGKLLHMLLHMPPALARICAFQFLAWSAWFYHRYYPLSEEWHSLAAKVTGWLTCDRSGS